MQLNVLDLVLQYLLDLDNRLDVYAGADSYMNVAMLLSIIRKSAYILPNLLQEE